MLHAAIAKKIAKPLVFVKLISDRRGTTVVKLVDTSTSESNPTYYALKFSEANSDTAKLIENEALVLQDLTNFTDGLYCDSGEFDNQAYLLTKWLEGRRLVDVVRDVKSIADRCERRVGWLELALNLTKKVHELHTLDYLHYDIQPEHFREIDGKLQLFDFGLSCMGDSINILYKGALIHYQSPEVCNYIVQESKIIQYDIISEIYSVAATLFVLYTNKTVMDYDHKPSLNEKWQIIATGTPRTFKEVEAEAFPELEAVLQACLVPDRDKRMADLSEVIMALEDILTVHESTDKE